MVQRREGKRTGGSNVPVADLCPLPGARRGRWQSVGLRGAAAALLGAALMTGGAALLVRLRPVAEGWSGGRSSPVLATLNGPLHGVFSVAPGHCNLVGAPSGSYVELQEHGVPVPNPSSPCPLTSAFYTPLRTGAVGLVSGAYQLDPSPTFNHSGGSEANAIVTPVPFLGVGFGIATTCADQQHQGTPTGACAPGVKGFPVPQLYAEPLGTGGCKVSLTNISGVVDMCIYGNLTGLGVTYNGTPNGTCADGGGNGCYAVGAASGPSLRATSCGPAPVGDCSLSGTLDPITDAYTLQVTSTIVGTSFNGAKAIFSFSGTYKPGIPSRTTSTTGPGASAGSPSSAPSPTSPGISPSPTAGTSGHAMNGVFQLSPGACAGSGAPTGSWIQLGLGGAPVKNASSSCDGGAYTPVRQGTTGLRTGTFQPDPTPTFDSSGNSLAGAVIAPTRFLGTDFGAATDPQNMQDAPSGPDVFPPPSAVLAGDVVHANLSAVNFTYNGPANGTCASGGGDGCYAVGSTDVVGSYDPATGGYVLSWTSIIHGGAFNNATASFHLVGRFVGTIAATDSILTTAGASSASSATTAGGPGSSASTGSLAAASDSGPVQNAMVGTFTIGSGTCSGSAAPSGSWIQLGKGGAPIPNPSSSCDGGDYTPLRQGTTGLLTGTFEPDPVPTFDSSGNSLAGAIIAPTKFIGTDFGAATDPQDMQHAPHGPNVFPAPSAVLSASHTSFTADLSALNFTYNGTPGGTCASGNGDGCYAVGSPHVLGTYDPVSHAYAMAWTATIVGGAFNGATATFHLAGTFNGHIQAVAAGSPSAPGTSSGVPATSAPSPRGTASAISVTSDTLAGRGPWPTILDATVLAIAAAIVAATIVDTRRRRHHAPGADAPPPAKAGS